MTRAAVDKVDLANAVAEFKLSSERAVTEARLTTERAVTEAKLAEEQARSDFNVRFLRLQLLVAALIVIQLTSAAPDSLLGQLARNVLSSAPF